MTILVGVLATDGAVVAADRAVTFGPDPRLHTISDRMQKVFCVQDNVIVAGTGQVGMAQRFAKISGEFFEHLRTFKKPAPATPPKVPTAQQLQEQAVQNQLQMFQKQVQVLEGQLQRVSQAQLVAEQVVHQGRSNDGPHLGTALSQLMNGELARTQANKGQFGALAAYVANGKPHLCDFGVADFQPEQKDDGCWYASMGSGQILADPYLALMRRTFWKSGRPDVQTALFTAMWVIQHAIDAAPGLIARPIDVAVLKKWDGKNYSAQLLDAKALFEQENSAIALDEHFSAFKRTPPDAIEPVPAGPPIQEIVNDNRAEGR